MLQSIIVNNYIDLKLISNVSISIVLGVAGSGLVIDFLKWFFKEVIPWDLVIKYVLNIISPITYEIFTATSKDLTYSKIIAIPAVQNEHFVIFIQIKPKTKYPYLYKNKNAFLTINLEDDERRIATWDRVEFAPNIKRISQYDNVNVLQSRTAHFKAGRSGYENINGYSFTLHLTVDNDSFKEVIAVNVV